MLMSCTWNLLLIAARGWTLRGNLTTLDGPGSGRYTQIRIAEDGLATIVWNGMPGLRLSRCTDILCTAATKPITIYNSSGLYYSAKKKLNVIANVSLDSANKFHRSKIAILKTVCRLADNKSAVCANGT